MFVSVLFVRGILAELAHRGHSAEAALDGLSLPETVLSEPRARVPFGDFERLLARAVQLTGDPGFGLTLGETAPETTLQLLGYLLLSCRTLRDSFDVLERYAALSIDGAGWSLSEREGRATFAFECPMLTDVGQRFASEYTMAMALRVARHFVSDLPLQLTSVQFRHEDPGYAARYQRVFGTAVQFGQPLNAISYPAALLDVPQRHADEATNWALRDTADRLLQTMDRPSSLAERVRGVLRSEAMLAAPEVEKLARTIGLTRRAMRRRLAAEGTSFTLLVDEARCRLACEELRRDGSVRTISERMGYSEPSAFYRAFRRWTGQTPSEFVRSA